MAAPLLLLLGALLAPSAARPPAAEGSAAPTVQVRVGVLLPEDLRLPWARLRVLPALLLALEALRPQLSLDGLDVRTASISLEEEDGMCGEAVSLFKAAELRGSHDPDVLLGLGCADSGYLLQPFALYWRLPVLLAGSYPKAGRIPGEVNAGPAGPSLPAFQIRLFQHFRWTGRAVMVLSRGVDCVRYYDFLWDSSWRQLAPERPDVSVPPLAYEEPGDAVRYIQARGRVVFICGPQEMLHQIMQLAQAQNMTNGDYVFFYLDLFGESLRAAGHREAGKPWQSKENPDTGGLREAFQTVLVITPHASQIPEYQSFKNELVLRAQRDFGVQINDSLGHLVAGCFHDGLLLYLRALNETLHEGGTKRNTSCILEKMRSLKIQGVTGTVSINSNNDREMDFDLWAMRDMETGEYQVVAHYTASENQINWTEPILWRNGAPPLENPPCVFDMDDPSCVKNGYIQEFFPGAPVLFYGVVLHTR